MDDCIFCKIANGEIPSEKVFESDDVVVFKDLDPKAPAHLLAIPKAHIESCADVTPENSGAVARCFEAIAAATRQQGIKSFRVVSNAGADAGQSVPHLHFHVLAGRAFAWPPG